MEEKLELKFAQIDKSGAINFTDKWILSEYNNGAFFLTKDNKSLVGRRIIMIDDNEEEIWTSKIMYMDNVFLIAIRLSIIAYHLMPLILKIHLI